MGILSIPRVGFGSQRQHRSLLGRCSLLAPYAARPSIGIITCRCICGGMDLNIEKDQNPSEGHNQQQC
ncbi:unnamed protein product, partial [Vitis vinifera]